LWWYVVTESDLAQLHGIGATAIERLCQALAAAGRLNQARQSASGPARPWAWRSRSTPSARRTRRYASSGGNTDLLAFETDSSESFFTQTCARHASLRVGGRLAG